MTQDPARDYLREKADLLPETRKKMIAPYGRRLRPRKDGGDARWVYGSTFMPPEAGQRYNRLESEPQPHMSPSCPRQFHGDPIDKPEDVIWDPVTPNGQPIRGKAYISQYRDVREFGNVYGYNVR